MVNKEQPMSTCGIENQEENQFDVFGKSVAAQLKSLPYDNALTAQSKIQEYLTDLAISNYRNKNVPAYSTTGISSTASSDIDSVMSK